MTRGIRGMDTLTSDEGMGDVAHARSDTNAHRRREGACPDPRREDGNQSEADAAPVAGNLVRVISAQSLFSLNGSIAWSSSKVCQRPRSRGRKPETTTSI
jgi:hypothetical protein